MELGQAVIWGDMANPEKTGYIAKIEAHENKVYTLGAGGMEREHFQLSIAWEDLTTSQISEGIAKPLIERAAKYDIAPMSEADALDLYTRAQAAEAAEYQKRQEAAAAQAQRISQWRDSIRDKIPADAKAVMVAEYEEDNCDTMSDYFNTKTTKTVILGFSTHTRDIFSEMRKAARNYERTAELADAPASAEHREKYSMGAGYYLKAEHRYDSGWKVSKRAFYGKGNDIAENIPYGEWSVPEQAAEMEQTSAAPVDIEAPEGFTVSAHTHTKKGFQMYIVETADRVERETFLQWLNQAKGLRGWYTRKWGSTPAGFAFKDQDAAKTFMEAIA